MATTLIGPPLDADEIAGLGADLLAAQGELEAGVLPLLDLVMRGDAPVESLGAAWRMIEDVADDLTVAVATIQAA